MEMADKALESMLARERLSSDPKCKKCVRGRLGYAKRGNVYVAVICPCIKKSMGQKLEARS
jgi:hypothetical protein